MDTIKNLTVGGVGMAGVEIANYLPPPEVDLQQSSVSLIIQIVIAVATLFKMFKKPKGV
jgi:hypothetical protein